MAGRVWDVIAASSEERESEKRNVPRAVSGVALFECWWWWW